MKIPPSEPKVSLQRRRIAQAAILLAHGAILLPAIARAQGSVPLTPECRPGAATTQAQTEGPFYTPSTPQRRSLRDPGIAGTALTLVGVVLTPDCAPVAGAMLDFWQADGEGTYDNRGFRLRGHQFTDASGRYQLETVLPGLYPGRTRHIHVKVRGPRGRVLTTQIYFPGEAANAGDRIFRRELLVRTSGSEARFDFVIEA